MSDHWSLTKQLTVRPTEKPTRRKEGKMIRAETKWKEWLYIRMYEKEFELVDTGKIKNYE